eukprot:6145669-Amphidinium_carterae.1
MGKATVMFHAHATVTCGNSREARCYRLPQSIKASPRKENAELLQISQRLQQGCSSSLSEWGLPLGTSR